MTLGHTLARKLTGVALFLSTVILSNPASRAETVTAFDEQPGTFAFASQQSTVAEGDGTARVTIVRTCGAAGIASVRYNFVSETRPEDYTVNGQSVTFEPGVTEKTIEIPIIDDDVHEASESFFIQLSDPTGGAIVGDPGLHTVTILDDDDGPGVFVFSADSTVVQENAGKVLITIVRKNGAGGTVSVSYTTAPTGALGATSDIDYVNTSGTVTFEPGITQKTIEVPIIDDAQFESFEQFCVFIFSPTGGATLDFVSVESVFIIDDDDGPGIFSFATDKSTVMEDAGHALVTVVRNRGAIGTASVSYSTGEFSANGADSYRWTGGTLTFGPGVTEQTIAVPLINDSVFNTSIFEEGRRFFIDLFEPTGGARLENPSRHAVTIQDDEPKPPPQSVPILSFRASHGAVSESQAVVYITVTRSGNLTETAYVSWHTSAGTAEADSDFTSRSGTLTFPPSVKELTFLVPINNDHLAEDLETFLVTLTDPIGGAAVLGPQFTHTVTIFSDDGDSTIAFAGALTEVRESSEQAAVTIFRSGSTVSPVDVEILLIPGSAESESDYLFERRHYTIPAGFTTQTLFIPIIDNAFAEDEEQFTLVLSTPVGAVLGSQRTHTIKILDDTGDAPSFRRATYRGFLENDYAPIEFGSIVLTITPTGHFTGTVKTRGKALPFKGRFADAATPAVASTSPKGAFLGGFLSFRADDANAILHGAFERRDQTRFSFEARRDAVGSRSHPVKEANTYTALLESQLPPLYPVGIVSAHVLASGRIKLSGMLPDGTGFSSSSHLSEEGRFPIFIPHYISKLSSLAGGGQIALDRLRPLSGDFHWQKPADSKPPYSGGLFDELMLLSGGVYQPVGQPRILDDFNSTEGGALLQIGETESSPSLDVPLVWGSDNTIRATSSSNLPPVKVVLRPQTGVLKGSFLDTTGRLRAFYGICLQQSGKEGADQVTGFYLGDEMSGRFEILPKATSTPATP